MVKRFFPFKLAFVSLGQVNSENAILNNLDGLIFRAGVGTTSLYVGCGILFN